MLVIFINYLSKTKKKWKTETQEEQKLNIIISA